MDKETFSVDLMFVVLIMFGLTENSTDLPNHRIKLENLLLPQVKHLRMTGVLLSTLIMLG